MERRLGVLSLGMSILSSFAAVLSYGRAGARGKRVSNDHGRKGEENMWLTVAVGPEGRGRIQ